MLSQLQSKIKSINKLCFLICFLLLVDKDEMNKLLRKHFLFFCIRTRFTMDSLNIKDFYVEQNTYLC